MWQKLLTRKYSGLRNWLLQRFTALFMALYCLVVIIYFALEQPWQYEAWQQFFSPWWMRLSTQLFIFSLLAHSWLGVRDVVKDYLPRWRIAAQSLMALCVSGYAIWSVFIVWGA